MTDPIIDLVIRIKNGYMAKKNQISSPYSVFREAVLKKLVALRYVKSYLLEEEHKKTLVIELLYHEGTPAMTDVVPYSTPGQRQYFAYKNLKPVQSGYGYSVLSTAKGIMTNIEARKNKIGGELLFMIW